MINKLKSLFVSFLALPGSWEWAVVQMKEGKIVYRTSSPESIKYINNYEASGPICDGDLDAVDWKIK